MVNKASRAEIREKKHRRLRHHLNGTATTPRLAVFRSINTCMHRLSMTPLERL